MFNTRGWIVSTARIAVVMLFGLMCFQLGYQSGFTGGDWKRLERQMDRNADGVESHAALPADERDAGFLVQSHLHVPQDCAAFNEECESASAG
jgi:hypothetical protein